MHLNRYFTGIFLAFLCACHQTEIEEPNSRTEPTIEKALVASSLRSLAVGDSIVLDAGFVSDGPIDSNEVQYTWKFMGSDAQALEVATGEIAKWIPQKAGQYQVNLEITYKGKSTSALVIFVVVEKSIIVFEDGSSEKRLKEMIHHMPGHYAGVMTSPWIPACSVSMIFHEDGTYSAWNATTSDHPALYYGTDEDGPEKTWALTDLRADGAATGNFTILFDVGTTVQNDMKTVRFDSTFQFLKWEFMHFGKYGPVHLNLKRVPKEDLPPRALPSPEFDALSTPMEGWDGVAHFSLLPKPGMRIYYQVIRETPGTWVMNAPESWDLAQALPVEGGLEIPDPGYNLILMVRATDGKHWSGVTAQQVWYKR